MISSWSCVLPCNSVRRVWRAGRLAASGNISTQYLSMTGRIALSCTKTVHLTTSSGVPPAAASTREPVHRHQDQAIREHLGQDHELGLLVQLDRCTARSGEAMRGECDQHNTNS